jgi:asparagine synthase (glutamine-hydrolysing)
MLWRQSFGAWPCLPHIDREVLATIGAMPLHSVAGRRMEIDLIKLRYPKLARLPLDRNSWDTSPLVGTAPGNAKRYLQRKWARALDRYTSGRPERRFYYRTMDFNGDYWTEVRRQLEPLRGKVSHLFQMDSFDALVPPAGERWRRGDAVQGSLGVKTLLGLVALVAHQPNLSETDARSPVDTSLSFAQSRKSTLGPVDPD